MKNYADITILLDRSGSMASIKDAMQVAFDNFIKEHRAVPSTKVTLVQFDDINDYDVVYQSVPVRSVERLSLNPRGNTPLIDAFAKTIDRTGTRYSNMSESERPERVLMIVITDGQENASHSYKRSDVRERVKRQHENYKWQFVYLGANQDSFAEAQSYGFNWGNTMTFSPEFARLQASSGALSVNTMSYAAGTSPTVDVFTEQQRNNSATKKDRAMESTHTHTTTGTGPNDNKV